MEGAEKQERPDDGEAPDVGGVVEVVRPDVASGGPVERGKRRNDIVEGSPVRRRQRVYNVDGGAKPSSVS
jgi:hypothetical protein